MQKKQLVIGAVVLLAVAAGSFYGGMKYQSGKRPATFAGTGAGAGFTFTGGTGAMRRIGGMGGGLVAGEVISKDATSVTVKLADGSTRIVLVTDTTPVQKSVAGSLFDIVVGTNVIVTGSANQDGSLTAQSLQIRPAAPAPAAK